MMPDFPTRDQARGLLILRGVQCDNNSDARAIIQAYIDGRLVMVEAVADGEITFDGYKFSLDDEFDYERTGRYLLLKLDDAE